MIEDADLKGRRLAQYMWTELEKIAQSGKSSDRRRKAVVGAGALGLLGAGVFLSRRGGRRTVARAGAEMESLFQKGEKAAERSREAAKALSGVKLKVVDTDAIESQTRKMRDTLEKWKEKIAQNAAVQQQQQGDAQTGELEGTVQREVEGDEEASPAHGIVASRVEQLSDKKARGIPVLDPPPGMVYAPELQAFVPDPQDPGWIQAEQAAEAAKAQSFYAQGQADLQQQQAQAEIDQKADVEAQQMAAQGAAQEQQQAAEQQAQMQAPQEQMQADAKAMAKEKAKSVAGGLKTPSDVKGGKPKAKKKPAEKSDAKGVTIKIGKD